MIFLVTLSFALFSGRKDKSQFTFSDQPNFIVIVSDDQRYDSVKDVMPFTYSELFEKGISFSKAYVTTPACCPSRSSILTGLNASNHGVHTNSFPLNKKTIAHALHENGYFTGIVGKYLNSWDGTPKSEFDFWISHRGGHVKYYNPKLNVNGEWKIVSGYSTYIFADYAEEFLKKAKLSTKPFFLYFTPNAPHSPALPAPEERKTNPNYPLFRPESYQEGDKSDKPNWVKENLLTDKTWRINDNARQRQLNSLIALDRSIQKIINSIKELNLSEDTVIFYISDNGVLWGEHGLIRKDVAYEEAIHVPFAIKIPGLSSKSSNALVANIDITPTIIDLSNIEFSESFDGKSLMPLITGKLNSIRESLQIEGWGQKSENKPRFKAIHTGKTVTITYENDHTEKYDLEKDPLQLNNIADNK